METIQASSAVAVPPVPRADLASSRGGAIQNDMDSPPSTIPLDEGSFLYPDLERQLPSNGPMGVEPRSDPIMIDDSEDDGPPQPSSRPRRANAGRPDYTYKAFLDRIEDATTTSGQRKRRRTRGNLDVETADITSILDDSYTKIEGHYRLLYRMVKGLEEELLVSRQQNQASKEELLVSHQQNQELKEELLVSRQQNQELKDHNEELKGSKQENDELRKQKEDLQEKLRASEEQTQKLQQALDKRKNHMYLQCGICLESSKAYWRRLGCGHVYCTTCISAMDEAEPLFNSNCPHCREPIESCKAFYPLLEHDN